MRMITKEDILGKLEELDPPVQDAEEVAASLWQAASDDNLFQALGVTAPPNILTVEHLPDVGWEITTTLGTMLISEDCATARRKEIDIQSGAHIQRGTGHTGAKKTGMDD